MPDSGLRERLRCLLRIDERPAPTLLRGEAEEHDGGAIERLTLDLGAPVEAVLTRPTTPGRHPAILYCHAHGNRPEIGRHELLDGRPALVSPYGPALAAAGFVTLCVDTPCFGDRLEPNESALSKALLWRGDSLWGLMLRELTSALDHLAARADVDPARIATLGISMGALHAFWLGALDERIARVAQLCCFADVATLVELGAHDRHGLYYLFPGLLGLARTGEIAGLVAPRPQLITIGRDDVLTPPAALDRAMADAREAYGPTGPLHLLAEDGVGHQETPTMRAAVMEFLAEML